MLKPVSQRVREWGNRAYTSEVCRQIRPPDANKSANREVRNAPIVLIKAA
jgi:hypothetical protein